MSSIVFARTRHTYDSYTDFWRLVEAADFPVQYTDEIDPDAEGTTYVFTPINGDVMALLPSWRSRRARIIWWNLERPEDDTLEASLASVEGALDEIWVPDRTFAARSPKFRYVPIAGHVSFGTRASERIHDVCHLAYIWGRREAPVSALRRMGVKIAPAAWGRAGQDEVVARSHLMLNMHQYAGIGTVAPLRFAVAASYAIPIVSESFADGEAVALTVAHAPIEELPKVVSELLKAPVHLQQAGGALHHRLCVKTDFGRGVREALS
jgi:hypothetical protein